MNYEWPVSTRRQILLLVHISVGSQQETDVPALVTFFTLRVTLSVSLSTSFFPVQQNELNCDVVGWLVEKGGSNAVIQSALADHFACTQTHSKTHGTEPEVGPKQHRGNSQNYPSAHDYS